MKNLILSIIVTLVLSVGVLSQTRDRVVGGTAEQRSKIAFLEAQVNELKYQIKVRQNKIGLTLCRQNIVCKESFKTLFNKETNDRTLREQRDLIEYYKRLYLNSALIGLRIR